MGEIIVVGVDGSETALEAARTAARLAAGMGASLRVVTAYDGDTGGVVAIGSDRWMFSDAAQAEIMTADIARLLGTTTSEISCAAVPGKPQDVLIGEAERLNAKLIVVGNRRMQGLGRVLGSVANTVAHNAPCDVYIVKTT
ncbi:nucleotide-binding universal stress UspA family protein [Arthrobacter ginsengisoli]|uniref:Nucleotide-binding universal stress UspA family protein n=1 Tax=Arthrobacter ginsengisoli TaxID=1356565 RepID=A0ABU1UG25_9MICC|nr:universal stress protein [Arthrobacter ginsengisoli]MDR7084147.1 nucleotide-binding universal stress UspA family protein [Arthrobacter ginsengisoli]